MRLLPALVLLLLLFCGTVGAAETSTPYVAVSIAEVDPADGAVLHGNDNVYVHVHYVSDVPIKVWVRPFFQGKEVSAYSNGSFGYPAGEDEAFGWFGLHQAGQVDSIHLQIARTDSGYPFKEDAFPANYRWDGQPGNWHEPAAWVKPMQEHEQAEQKKAYDAYMSQPLGASGIVAIVLFYLAVLGALFACFVWPVYGLIRWREKWRWLAGAPLAIVGLKTLGIMVDTARDPTSHNLLPFEYLILATIVAPYMLVVWLLRRAALRREAA